VLILLFFGTLLDMVVPVVNSMIFSDVIPNSDRTLLGQLFFLLLITSLAKTIIDAMSRKLIWTTNEVAQRSMQMAFFDHVLRLPVSFFRQYSPGEMAMRSIGIQNLFSNLNTNCFLTFFNLLFLIFPVGMLFYYSAKMAGIMLCFLVPMVMLSAFFSIRISKLHYRILSKQGEINGLLERFIANVGKLHAAGAENHVLLVWIRKFAGKQEISAQSERCMMIVQVIFSILNWGIFCVEMGVILWMYSKSEPEDLITAGDFTGFISAMAIVSAALLGMLDSLKRCLQVGPVFKWLAPLLLEEEEKDAAPQTVSGDGSVIRGGIELDNVSFSYGSDRQILKNVSIKAAPGEFIAITGESGAGKSTILRLMLRFEKPSSGTVLYDGEDADTKNMAHIRSQIGVVLQNASLLPISILDNIIGMTSRYTEEDAWRVAELTGCADDIRSWPMQMQTILTGSTISCGQQQRILLAHALIRNPKLIFLDEATSALDNRTQRIIIGTLKKIQATKVVIAHRLSTIIDADRIYVLKQGSVVEVGTYRELMEKQGVFAEMAARQLTDGSGE